MSAHNDTASRLKEAAAAHTMKDWSFLRSILPQE